jgi:glutaminyl-tRNA synthetase
MSESNTPTEAEEAPAARRHFIQERIDADLESGVDGGRVHLRFPPEPNGYLHIGHAKAICVNFGLAEEYPGGKCNLRFDDTNPSKEKTEYVESIQRDIRWLGFDWEDRCFFASDYFEQLYQWAVQLIEQGDAFVCDLQGDQISEYRGGAERPGRPSPWRDRSVEENLDLFKRMRAGEFEEGERTLRAKIDVNAPNMVMRDPVLYRIMKVEHHRTGDAWVIYPTYDWAHGQGDAIEGITHSLCSMEFENHRPLYEWCLEKLGIENGPRQIEFSRLEMTHLITSKRKLLRLVEEGRVSGWDDPRMPTISGMRRRGYTPEAVRAFISDAGVTRFPGKTDVVRLENALRADLNRRAERRMAVLRPLKLVITNLPEGHREELSAVNNPEDEAAGSRPVHFGRELWIERSDFMEDAPRKFFRLKPGGEVRLRYAYVVRCDEVVKDDAGEVTELRCTYDPETGQGRAPEGRKVKGVIHWVNAADAVEAEVREYDHLFAAEDPNDHPEDGDFLDNLNPDSLNVVERAWLEPALGSAGEGETFQFERLGYYCVDRDSTPERPVFNRAVTLRDSWAKKDGPKQGGGQQKKKG